MAAHGLKRARPAELVPGTVSVVAVRMNYLGMHCFPLAGERDSPDTHPSNIDWRQHEWQRLDRPGEAVVSLYARGRDYHKVMRNRLQQLQRRMAELLGPFGHRVFCDSAPVLEVEIATRAGLGWRGKHTLTLSRDAGSMFFLGELFVDLALPPTLPAPPDPGAHCGQCSACMDRCPTQAIVAPYRVDARRCISYLTIEHAGPIPHELRPLVGNRVYGCDDCQLACPWNKFAQPAVLADFDARPGMHGGPDGGLAALMRWSEDEFLRRTEGSAIRRIGHARWLRNVALAIGNAAGQAAAHVATRPVQAEQREAMLAALALWRQHPDAVVREQVAWSQRRWAEAARTA
jgi:epoxyqueuosine reductase